MVQLAILKYQVATSNLVPNPSWPIGMPYLGLDPVNESVIADMDRDGDMEIFVPTWNQNGIIAFDNQSELIVVQSNNSKTRKSGNCRF